MDPVGNAYVTGLSSDNVFKIVPDADGDGVPDANDNCPNDPNKLGPGICGCGVSDADTDGDGVPDCFDPCPNDPNKLLPAICGCGTPDSLDDGDGDGIIDCLDNCPTTANADQADGDVNGVGDVCEPTQAGQPTADTCGCGTGLDGMMLMPMTLLGIGWMRRRMSRQSRRAGTRGGDSAAFQNLRRNQK